MTSAPQLSRRHPYIAKSYRFKSTDFASVMIDEVGCSRRHVFPRCGNGNILWPLLFSSSTTEVAHVFIWWTFITWVPTPPYNYLLRPTESKAQTYFNSLVWSKIHLKNAGKRINRSKWDLVFFYHTLKNSAIIITFWATPLLTLNVERNLLFSTDFLPLFMFLYIAQVCLLYFLSKVFRSQISYFTKHSYYHSP